jgi:O-Antigen ligase
MFKLLIFVPHLLFFLMLFVPTTYPEIKIPLILITILIIFNDVKDKKHQILSRPILNWVLLQVGSGLFFVTWGCMNNTPGAVRVSTVILLWPILYTIFMAGISNLQRLKSLVNVLLCAGIAVPIYSLSYVLSNMGIIPGYLYIDIDQGQALGLYESSIKYNLYSITSLIFLIPYLASKYLCSDPAINYSKPTSLVGLLLCVVSLLISGRRGLFISAIVGLLIHTILSIISSKSISNQRLTKKETSSIFVFGVVLACSIYVFQNVFGYGLDSIFGMFQSISDFNDDESNVIRKEQFDALIRGWSDHPLIGAGHGASAEKYGSLRGGDEQPWAYELSYIALLYQTGIIGFTIWWGGIIWIFAMGIKIIRENTILSKELINMLSGTGGFLAANASNPYLAKYDYMWVVYLPLAIINLYIILKSKAQGSNSLVIYTKIN